MAKKILQAIGNIVTVLLVVIIGISAFSMIQSKRSPGYIPNAAGYSCMTVLTGSMSPVLNPGDMVIVRKTDSSAVKTGDIITFKASEGIIITHRVLEVVNKDGSTAFKTKGDANNTADGSLVYQNQLIGKMVGKIPYGGYAARFARSTAGFVLLIILPVVLIISMELKTILSDFAKGDKKSKHKDSVET